MTENRQKFTTIHKEPFLLHHSPTNFRLPSFAPAVRTTLKACLFEQWNDVHASSPVISLFTSWHNF